ncbi:hypothetical protein [Lysinibacillus xylanilyticus]|uniref:Conjugal transfer protein TrbL n=1 Tax=Lysinibacillus xylanilyticus TaxID=582475 RepID=A0A2M9QA46_9BACI|nr:hypothetical protein [Lysinibacillus xylanilyticus]PJO44944.1 hypothetical protein CWD94_04470 [Lysinibacillus xylanilyticus]
MKKAKVLLLLLIISLSLSPITAYARLDEGTGTPLDSLDKGSSEKGSNDKSGIDAGYSLGGFSCGKPLISEDVDKEINDYKENDANMAEKFLTSQVQNFFHIGPINSMSTLVFGNPYCIWAGKDAKMSADGIFTSDERKKIIEPLLKLFGSLFFLVLVLSMLITGLKTMGNSVRGQAMDEFWTDAKMWFVALFLAFFYNDWTNWLFQINAGIVLDILDLLKANTNKMDNLSVMSSISDFLPGLMGSFLLVAIGEWILAGVLNVVYLARKVVILLLLVLGFVAIYSLMFAKTRAFFGNWFRELIGNVFLQSIHAIVFYAMVMFTSLGASVFFKIGLMIMFIPVSGMISKWLNIGDSSSKVGSALTMVGLGGVASTVMLASQAKSVMYGGSLTSNGGLLNSNSTNSAGGDSLANLANSIANDSASTSISSSASGTNSSLFNMAKDVSSKMGTIVGGGAGVVAGPVASVLGAKVGGAVGGGLVQFGRNATVGVSNLLSNFSQARKFTNENGTGFKALFGKNGNFETLNARRQVMGNFGESLGVILAGQKGASIGRNAGFALSGVSRQRLASEMSSSFNMRDASGNLQPTTFSALAQRYPNAEMKWMQTNQGSGFYINTNDGWRQVGLTGAADSSLKDGQARVMDYTLADPALNYEYQSNGTYKAPSQLSEAAISGSVNTTSDSIANVTSVPSFEEAMSGGHIAAPLSNSINNSASLTEATISGSVITSSDSIANVTSVPSFDPAMSGGNVAAPISNSISGSVSSTEAVTSSSSSSQDSIPISQPSISGATGDGNTSTIPTQTISGDSGRDSLNSLPPQTVQGSNASNQKMETVGLQGSTPSVMRKSEAYIVNTGESNLAMNPKTVEQVVSSKVVHQDAGFNAKKVNPDAYVYHNVSGSDTRTISDKAADIVHNVGKVSNVWKEKAQKQSRTARVKKIV